MIKPLRIACIQNNAGSQWENNLDRLDSLIARALKKKPKIIALAEVFFWRGEKSHLDFIARYLTPRVIEGFLQIAKKTKTCFLLGSVIEKSDIKNRFYNTSYLISEKGNIAAKYRKIHLFDIGLKKKVETSESRSIKAGKQVVSGRVWGLKAGLSICYDVRFPELYRKLSREGCRILFVPANFTYETGKAHWELLLRARAVENQCFVVAPGQVGAHPGNGIKSYGNSMVVDPWGRVLGRAGAAREEVIFADLDLSVQDRLRKDFPVLKHRRM